jgi:hypothetical protein
MYGRSSELVLIGGPRFSTVGYPLFQPFVAGLHRLETMWLYVSRGTGYWGPPLRLGAPAEITLLRLTRAEERGDRGGVLTTSQVPDM